MIYHILTANTTHHIPDMVRNILKYSNLTNEGGAEEHFFWLRKNKGDKKGLSYFYSNLFNDELRHKGYGFINSNFQLMLLLTKLSKTNKIIIHSIQSLFQRPLLFWFFTHYFLSKSKKKNIRQIMWGLPMSIDKKQKGLIRKELFKTQRKAMNSLGYIVVLSQDDRHKASQFYNLKNLIVANYIRDAYTHYNSIGRSKQQNKALQIMVAHSAFPHNNHFRTFKDLEIFRDKDLKIICPLSYGKEEYKNEILKKGKELFGGKFSPYIKLLPREEYHKLLASLDIYISHAEMQTSLYVVNYCICTGTKMYLNQNNYNWMKYQGFKVNHVNELEKITFDDLVKPLSQDLIEHNTGLAKKILSAEERAKKWRLMYS